MPVAGTKKYQVKTGTQPEVTVSVFFTQQDEKFYVPVSDEHYTKLTDQERTDLGIERANKGMTSYYAVVADKFAEAFQKYTKVLDAVHDTVEGIEAIPMILVKFGAKVREATELRHGHDGERERERKLLMHSGEGRHFASSMMEMSMDFYRVWHIKSNKREGVIERPLESCKPEHIRYALNNGFRGDGLGYEGKVFYLPWSEATWGSLQRFHGHMLELMIKLDELISGDVAAKLLAVSNKKLLG